MSTAEKPRHIISISGGKDSAALAIYLMQTQQIENPEYVFMDTEVELPETYEFLDQLESILGKEINRLTPTVHFERLLKLHNGFLPSAQQRWCTINMKIKPFEKFVGDDHAYSYIGIRADENRDGFISKKGNIIPVYPFIEDGITKADVNRILEDSGLGLPKYYDWRSRSGCYFCFFQQQVEWVGLAENHPDLFEKAKAFEQTSSDGTGNYTWTDSGSLDQVIKRKETIRAKFEKRMRAQRKRPKNAKLIDIMREIDPFEEADTFEAAMREMDQGEGCLICHL